MKKILVLLFMLLSVVIISGCNKDVKDISHNIVFDTQGGNQISSQYIVIGEDSFSLPIPYREGYSFEGWFYSENYTGNSITEISNTLAEDTTIYAKWSVNQYTITYLETEVEYNELVDTLVELPVTVSRVVLGRNHAGLITTNGRVFMWGENSCGQLGNKTRYSSNTPIKISSFTNLENGESIIELVVGESYSAALTSFGKVFMWGCNNNNIINDGSFEIFSVPMDVTERFDLESGDKIITLTSGRFHMGAISQSGKIFMWGLNDYSQLGTGNNEVITNPVDISSNFQLQSGEIIIKLSLGDNFSGILTSEGRVFLWGDNETGQLGDGTTIEKTLPTDITSYLDLSVGETVIDISLGNLHTGIVTSDGRVLTWGYNYHGQLGNYTRDNNLSPVDITSYFLLSNEETITKLVFETAISSAMSSSGRTFVWGFNNTGLIGDGTETQRNIPIDITSQFNLDGNAFIDELVVSIFRSCAITTEGNLFTWGYSIFDSPINQIKILEPTQLNFIVYSQVFSETVDYSSIIEEYIPIKPGYVFKGWFIDGMLLEAYDFSTMPAEDITLYAKWEPSSD